MDPKLALQKALPRMAWLVVMCAWHVLTLAQAGIEVDGTVRDKDSNRKLPGVEVQVLRGGSAYDAVSTLSNGKYSLSLEHGADYELRFTFGDLSPRKVLLNTSSIPESFRERPFYLTVEMSLFEVPDGFDSDLLDEPIGKVAFDPRKEQLAWDLDYTATMQARIDAALSAAESGGGAVEVSNEAYEEHMRKAEVEFGRERWAQSINWLERALNEIPGDARAERMMAEAVENEQAAEAEAAARREYEIQMREGKLAMRKEDWPVARSAFEQASGLLPGEQEPRDLLAEIDAMLSEQGAGEEAVEADYAAAVEEGNAAMSQGNLDLAEASFELAAELKPSERLPREKLAEIRQLRKQEGREADLMERKRMEYEAIIERADRAFDDQDFLKAKGLYEEATEILPDEVYPRTRAVEAAGLIVPIGLEDEEAEAETEPSASESADRIYEDHIRAGDLAFDAEDWSGAEAAYNAALEIRPDERYPKNRLRRLASLMGGGAEVEATMEVDREALMAQEAAAAEASSEQTAAVLEEQARMLEEERLAEEAEARRQQEEARSRNEKGRDRSRNYVMAIQNADEDEAEAYYRDALQSEIRARGQVVQERASKQEALNEVWTSNSDTRRQSALQSIERKVSEQSGNLYASASFREDRVASLESRVEQQSEAALDSRARGNAGRRDRYIEIEENKQKYSQTLLDRTKRYAVFVDSLDRMLQHYTDFHRDLRRTSVDNRIMQYEEIQRTASTHQRIGEGEDIRRMENLAGVRKTAQDDQQTRILSAGEASIRSASALRRAQSKDAGEPPTPDDYREVPAKEGIREGVDERSYEVGNTLVIERTVRVGNKIDVYRKSVAKHGVYYFKNDRSITRDIWVLETFEIRD